MLAFVRGHVSSATGIPLIYQLTKRSSGAGYSRHAILSRMSSREYEGLAMIRLPDSAGALPDRLVYDPGGSDIASIPIGCF